MVAAGRRDQLLSQDLARVMDGSTRVAGAPRSSGTPTGRKVGIPDFDADAIGRQAEYIRRNLRQNRVGAAADIGHVRLDDSDAVRTDTDPGPRGHLEMRADGGRHAIADQPPAVAQLPGLRRPSVPPEAARSFAHAFDHAAVAERDTGFGMNVRL